MRKMLMKYDFVMDSENLDINCSARIDAGVQWTAWMDKHLKCNIITKRSSQTLVYIFKEILKFLNMQIHS